MTRSRVRLTAKLNGRMYLTTEGAAELLGVSKAFVRRVASLPIGTDGIGLRSYGSGRRLLFTREAVIRYGNGEPMPFARWWMERGRG